MISGFLKLWGLLDQRGRRSTLVLFAMLLGLALAEVIGVAAVMPFIAILTDPELIQINKYLSAVFKGLGFSEPSSFLVFLGFITFFLVLGRIGLTALTSCASVRYKQMRIFSLATRLLETYMKRP